MCCNSSITVGRTVVVNDTKPYDAGQGWSVPVTEKPCKKPRICVRLKQQQNHRAGEHGPKRKRVQREHTEDWQTIQHYTLWPEHTASEVLKRT